MLVNHDILGLDVPMDYILGVQMTDCQKNLPHVFFALAFFKSFLVCMRYSLKQLDSLYILHDQKQVCLFVVGLKILNNVWMVYRLKDLYLSHDLVQVVL